MPKCIIIHIGRIYRGGLAQGVINQGAPPITAQMCKTRIGQNHTPFLKYWLFHYRTQDKSCIFLMPKKAITKNLDTRRNYI